MRTGDLVVLLADPLQYGYGRIDTVLPDGRVTVHWEGGNITPVHPHHLEHAARWEWATTRTLTDTDLQRLTNPGP